MTDKKKPKAPSASTFEKELQEATTGVGGSTTTTGAGSAGALSITAAQAGLPVTFSLPHSRQITNEIPDETTNAKGERVTTYAGAVEALYKMDSSEVEQAQRDLIDAGYLTESHAISGAVDTTTLSAWKKMALDAANSGTPVATLLAAGGAAPAIVDAMKGANSALQSAETSYADAKTGTFTETDPNEIIDSLNAALASIGEPPATPQLQQAFVSQFQGAEKQASTGELTAEKEGEGQAITSLQQQQSDLATGDTSGAASLATAPGPIITAGKATPNLDAESMAQAKASNPAQYYATQSSYLYGILNQMLYGAPSYQTAPTAPSQTAPGGAVTGTPLVGAEAAA